LRAATGAYILNSGLGKWEAEEEAATATHGFAAASYPFLKNNDPKTFNKGLAAAEITVGAALLTPVVPPLFAGLALAGFSGGLIGLYLRSPGMRQEGSLRPTEQGVPFAKDSWLLGIGASLAIDGIAQNIGRRRRRKRAERAAAAEIAEAANT
jgi:uncharacterized membrane protein YphA (DoxX/SURF4 family)